MIIQLTGLSGAGKTTISKLAAEQLISLGKSVKIIDGDEYRKTICADLGFTKEDRVENIKRLGEIAKNSTENIIIISAINPYEEARQYVGGKVVWIKCDLETLKERDTKGLYKKGLNGEINLTGVTDPYEEPNADLIIDTSKKSINESVDSLVNFIYNIPKALFIGRWQPFHKGHEWLVSQKLDKGVPVLIGVRDILPNEQNPYTTAETVKMIQDIYIGRDVEVIVIPNIESVNYGRSVGYEVNEFIPPSDIEQISASKIRELKAFKT